MFCYTTWWQRHNCVNLFAVIIIIIHKFHRDASLETKLQGRYHVMAGSPICEQLIKNTLNHHAALRKDTKMCYLFFGLITRRIRIRIKFHIRRN